MCRAIILIAAFLHGSAHLSPPPPPQPPHIPVAYGPANEFYPVSAARAAVIMSAWGESATAVATCTNTPLIVAWDPNFLGRNKIPEALLWTHGHASHGVEYWSITDFYRNPTSRWNQHDLYRRQPRRILVGLLDLANDANATLDLTPLVPREPVLWLESMWLKTTTTTTTTAARKRRRRT